MLQISQKAGAILALLVIPALSGCAVAAGAAAGGAGGYYVAKDERRAGQIAEDAAITAKVKSKLIEDKNVSAMKINVDTFYNVVTLHGDVPSEKMADRAISLARSVKGVKGVRSQLVIVRS
jgi:hyperosmotically inducible periplasmic protein